MNFITTILNMRYNFKSVNTLREFILKLITLTSASIVGAFAPIKRGSRINKSIFPPTSCTDLVV